MSTPWKSIVGTLILLSLFSGLIGCKSNGTGNWYSYKNYSFYNPLKAKDVAEKQAEEVTAIAATNPAEQATPEANRLAGPVVPVNENALYPNPVVHPSPGHYDFHAMQPASAEYQRTSLQQSNPYVVSTFAPVQGTVPQTQPYTYIDVNGNTTAPPQSTAPAAVAQNDGAAIF